MTIEEYQAAVERTMMEDGAENFLGYTLGLCGEVGEVADMVKKWRFHDHDIWAHDLEDEMGDVLWYWFAFCAQWNIDPIAIMERNVLKLKERYPEGFDTERSKNRDT